jgi:uncharacterized protein
MKIKTNMLIDKQLKEIIAAQREVFYRKNKGIERELLPHLSIIDGFVSILAGIRRCGKSTLMWQILDKNYPNSLILNFEDPRLAGFEIDDFNRLSNVIKEFKVDTLFFDEIQLIKNWEIFIRAKLDEGYRIFVTGSNASLLSKELGTKLTGRHLQYELFPFSYKEFLAFIGQVASEITFNDYLKRGGFPEYVKNNLGLILNQLLDDILYRDIAVRYGLRDIKTLRQLAVYLISNIGKPISATSLKNTFGLKSSSTILEYFSYLENSYVVEFLPMFSFSIKTQIRNPKKVYVIDLGLFTENSIIFSEESGRRLENAVYLYFRRKKYEIFYFKEKKECDFVVMRNNQLIDLVQVCFELNEFNLDREIAGLTDAMDFFKVNSGKIITISQEEILVKNGKTIEVIPAWKYFI